MFWLISIPVFINTATLRKGNLAKFSKVSHLKNEGSLTKTGEKARHEFYIKRFRNLMMSRSDGTRSFIV